MTNTLQLPSPAKLNLFLHITGRRPDGYHNLQTVFQLLEYGDTLSFSPHKTIEIVSDLDIPPEQNLIFRAANLLQNHSSTHYGVKIHLHKRLPIGGGIGGGSSNAATTLLGLNHLWQTGLTIDELALLGRQLGADVPVFVRGHSAWAQGIGDELEPMDLPERWYLVVQPPVQINTAKFFAHPHLTRDTAPISKEDFSAGQGHNDFEPLAREIFPEVAEIFDLLQPWQPRLTGSGSCVFAIFNNQTEAQLAQNKLPASLPGFISKGVKHSPLLEALGNTL